MLDVADGSSTADVAATIGPGLARAAIAGRYSANGQSTIVDLARPLPGDCELSILTASDEDPASLEILRHSTAHVMAEAICALFPQTKLVYGPPLEDGFYYDLDLDRPITPDDFERIEAEMKRIIKEDRTFCRYEMSREAGTEKLRGEGNRYKIDNAERAEGIALSFYVTGERRGEDFEDLCRGPHIPSTGRIKAFKVRQVSRSHYRGDVKDTPLQRVYGTAFFKKSSLKEHFARLEEAKKRDHRVLGRELELFAIDDKVGSGLVLWLPNGSVIRDELQRFLTGEMVKLGYDMIHTPVIGNLDLYRCSGHYPYYEDSQYPAMFESERGKALQSLLQLARRAVDAVDPAREEIVASVRRLAIAVQETWGAIEGLSADAPIDGIVKSLYTALESETGYLLRPMNCPHHIQVYASKMRSYRDLPVRLAEYGLVHRFEQSGEISGLTRVRGFTQDDAHIFCTADQLAAEIGATVALTQRVLETLGLGDYRVRIGLRDATSDKWIGSDENWAKSEAAVRAAVAESGIKHTEEPGEAAFYGPKIDFVVKDCIGREWQLGTVQVDYNAPQRFDLSYIGSDNRQHRPIMIHRAPFGSLERFVGILIEHFAGAFPLWLSPVQVAVVSVSEKSATYAQEVYATLRAAGIRAEVDTGDEKIGPKKHRMRGKKVNYVLVVGEREAEDGTVNVNDRDGRTLGNMTVAVLIEACRAEIDSKGGSPVAAG